MNPRQGLATQTMEWVLAELAMRFDYLLECLDASVQELMCVKIVWRLSRCGNRAHTRQRIERMAESWAGTEIHTMPMAAHAQDVGVEPCWLGFGGPGEIRTHDLFHAI